MKLLVYIMKKIAFLLLLCSLFACSRQAKNVPHSGERLLNKRIYLDSVVVDASYTSGWGNFYLVDSIITFADTYYSKFYDYKANSGDFVAEHFRKGNGPGELNEFMFAYPIRNKKDQCLIVDNSIMLHSFKQQDYELFHHGRINFGWNGLCKDYDSPRAYNIMYLTDYGVDFYYLNDSIIAFPVNLIDRFVSEKEIESDRYDKLHIFGELNVNTMIVERITGKMPEIYHEKPIPNFESFRFAMRGDTVYVNHYVDSLIYVYLYPDELIYTMGFEGRDIDRNYMQTTELDEGKTFMKDYKTVGSSAGLDYVPETNMLIRTYVKERVMRKTGLQLYQNSNMLADIDVPNYFMFLGYNNGWYYGVRKLPLETENDIRFVFYKFRIE